MTPSGEMEGLAGLITGTVTDEVGRAETATGYRTPLVGFADASDPRFAALKETAGPEHKSPEDLLPGARSVVSYFLPFEAGIVSANARDKEEVAPEWVRAYVETNILIGRINDRLKEVLDEAGVLSHGEPATANFYSGSLRSWWSHKSVGVIAGLGSFGFHRMVITHSGCAGRFGSLLIDRDLPVTPSWSVNKCLYLHNGSCRVCLSRCPVDALSESGDIDRQRCYARCLETAEKYREMGPASACGKCATGPCALGSAVKDNSP